MKNSTIGELDQQSLKLQEFLERQPHGAVLDYLDIQRETGVEMDTGGKARLRRALRRLQREYSSTRGFGVKLADAEGVMPILSTRIQRIDKAVKRADRSQKLLQEQFFASLSEQDQQRILFAGAVFGAIRLAADQGKQIQRTKMTSGATLHIPLPLIS